MERLKNWLKRNVFLFLFFIFSFVAGIALFCIFLYPYPDIVERKKALLTANHVERVEYIKKAIEESKRHQKSGVQELNPAYLTRRDQGALNELGLRSQLVRENERYRQEMSELGVFPISLGESISYISLLISFLGLHFIYRPKSTTGNVN